MNEQERIKADYERFLRTGDDYPHLQRAHDKKTSEKLFSAAVWCLIMSALAFIWSIVL